MRQTGNTKENISRRNINEKLFRTASVSAMIAAVSFLAVFLVSIFLQGVQALRQTEIKITVSYGVNAKRHPETAIQSRYTGLVSRGFVRAIPDRMENDKSVPGRTEQMWVPASSAMDQYIKHNHSDMTAADIITAEELKNSGRVRLSFNRWFFINGDSQLAEMAGIRSAIAGTIYLMLITMLFSLPVGVMTAIYMEEFSGGGRAARIMELSINNLAAIPSVILGLIGLAVFVSVFGAPRSSPLAGGLTLSLMTLPVIIITSRASLASVPSDIRQAARAVGATKWQTVWHHTLPLALPGIMTGSIIGLAQAIGETAPLLTIGMLAYIPNAPTDMAQASTALPVQIYLWSSEPNRAYAERTALGIMVLLGIMLLLNSAALIIRHKYDKKR